MMSLAKAVGDWQNGSIAPPPTNGSKYRAFSGNKWPRKGAIDRLLPGHLITGGNALGIIRHLEAEFRVRLANFHFRFDTLAAYVKEFIVGLKTRRIHSVSYRRQHVAPAAHKGNQARPAFRTRDQE